MAFGNKRLQGRSRSVDKREKREATPEQKARQKAWRTECLVDRATKGILSEKNRTEAANLGLIALIA